MGASCVHCIGHSFWVDPHFRCRPQPAVPLRSWLADVEGLSRISSPRIEVLASKLL